MTGASSITEYPVLFDQEAEPSPPGPYCVFTVTEQDVIHRSSGTASGTEHQVERVVVTFYVHAMGNTRRSAKKIAAELASAVMSAYDDEPLDVFPVEVICKSRMPDFGLKKDEQWYVWVVPYEIVYDKVIAKTTRRSLETG